MSNFTYKHGALCFFIGRYNLRANNNEKVATSARERVTSRLTKKYLKIIVENSPFLRKLIYQGYNLLIFKMTNYSHNFAKIIFRLTYYILGATQRYKKAVNQIFFSLIEQS